MLGFLGWTLMRPVWKVFLSPMFFQVLPPSVDLYTPSPYETELRGLFSPVPTQTMFRSEGATQTSPMETVFSRSNWCSKVMPLFTVLSSPPEAVATQYVLGSASKIERAIIRPPIAAGPIERHVRGLTHSGERPASTVGATVAPLVSLRSSASFLFISWICFSRSAICC